VSPGAAGPRRSDGALPNLVVIGAMKCGTTSLHHYLDLHPEIAMSRPKELNFFIGPDAAAHPDAPGPVDWRRGTWHSGPAWYAAHFDDAAPVRGEVSPGYTSPSHPCVAERMAALIPEAHLVYAVRDPIRRAVSQYWHHRRDGTEPRELEEALLDPAGQYIARGRYFDRLAPYLATGAFDGRIEIVAQEQLDAAGRAVMRRMFAHLGVDDGFWSADMDERRNESPDDAPALSPRLRARLTEAFRDDADRLREYSGKEFPAWTV
jgi:hypothetical protein